MSAIGWAVDLDHPADTVEVDLYIDGPPDHGTFVGRVHAGLSSPDLTAGNAKIQGPHRFRLPIPYVFRDGHPHSLYAYRIGPQDSRILIDGAPKQFTFLCSVLVCRDIPVSADGVL